MLLVLDDMEISPDFFDYFAATADLLEEDQLRAIEISTVQRVQVFLFFSS